MVKYLALDFDGVVADSINECLVTAHHAYSRFRGKHSFYLDLQAFSPQLVDAFRRMRPLIRRGEDYVFVMQAFEEKKALQDQQQFDSYLDFNEDRRENYRRLFYAERVRLQESNRESWLDLNPLYPGVASFLRGLLNPASTFVVTTKDLASVRLIFERHAIAVPDENLFQCTRDYRKPKILDKIAREQEIAQGHLHFVDDHVATVLEVKRNSGATCYCATWGYNTPNQLESLPAEGVEALSLEAFFETFDALANQPSP